MPQRKRKSRLSVMVLLGAIFAFLGLTYLLNGLATSSVDLVLHSLEVKASTERVLTIMLDAETGQRGFIITSNIEFLTPYEHARINASKEVDRLASLIADNPEQVGRLEKLRNLWIEKFSELKQTVDLVKSGNVDAAKGIVAEAQGKRLMDSIRNVVAEFQTEENRLLAVRSQGVKQQRWWTSALLLMGICALIALTYQELRRFYTQNIGLLAANRELDELVLERTQALELEKHRVVALLQDVTHRVGNNLAMVSALLSVQSRKSTNDEVKTALADARTRISAIAAGQRRLQLDLEADEVRAKPYLENLLSETVQTAQERGISLTYDIADIPLPGKDAISYIVLTNELATNALKHAFPNGMVGQIKVHLGIFEDAKSQTIELQVEDDGVGSNEVTTKPGLGHTIVQSLLKSMNATLETKVRWPDRERKGYSSVIRIPMSEITL